MYQSLVYPARRTEQEATRRSSCFLEFAREAELGVEPLDVERRPTGPDYSVTLTDFGAIQHLVGQFRRIVGVDHGLRLAEPPDFCFFAMATSHRDDAMGLVRDQDRRMRE